MLGENQISLALCRGLLQPFPPVPCCGNEIWAFDSARADPLDVQQHIHVGPSPKRQVAQHPQRRHQHQQEPRHAAMLNLTNPRSEVGKGTWPRFPERAPGGVVSSCPGSPGHSTLPRGLNLATLVCLLRHSPPGGAASPYNSACTPANTTGNRRGSFIALAMGRTRR